MADVLTPGCAVIKLSGTSGDGKTWDMTMHAQHPVASSPIPPGDLANLATTIAAGVFVADFPPLTTPDVILTSVSTRDVGVERGPATVEDVSVPGTGTGARLPMSSAASITEVINPTSVQRTHGRMLFPGVLEANVLGDNLTAGGITAYRTCVEGLLFDIGNASPVAGGVWNPVVRSTQHNGIPRPLGVVSTIQNITPRSRLATAVVRLRGRKTRH